MAFAHHAKPLWAPPGRAKVPQRGVGRVVRKKGKERRGVWCITERGKDNKRNGKHMTCGRAASTTLVYIDT